MLCHLTFSMLEASVLMAVRTVRTVRRRILRVETSVLVAVRAVRRTLREQVEVVALT